MEIFKTTEAFTYDDVLIVPGHSEILPAQTDVTSYFSRNIKLNIPIVSAAMDTVTESKTAITLAQEGGIGVIHKNMNPVLQAKEIEKVKKYSAGMIMDPFTIDPDESLQAVLALTKKHNITGLPVVDQNRILVGIITNRDIRFEENLNQKVRDVMTGKDRLVFAPENVSMEEAKRLLHKHRIEKLPIVDRDFKLKGLITVKDMEKKMAFPLANKDSLGRLRVAAAVSVGEKELERAELLVKAHVDALVIDTAHGHTKAVLEMVQELKKRYNSVDIVAGNVATAAACVDLIDLGIDGIKVGIGPGSICTTRIIAGIGVPQLSAIVDCRKVCNSAKIPYIADGGVKYSGDIVKALAAGANSVMIGSLFAGTDEAPGEMILYQGRYYKIYRGMGSLGAMAQGSKDRYGQAQIKEISKLVPEGIEGQVPYRGPLSQNIFQMVGGLRSGMGYVGAKNLKELAEKAKFIKVTSASLKEGHPHDVMITKEAPNYQLS